MQTFLQRELPPMAHPATKPERIRIGYFSADFHDHATMYLMARMFELHDSKRFAIHAYSYGRGGSEGGGDHMRGRLQRAVEAFHEVRDLEDREIAELGRSHGLDIAVDLKGYTQHARLGAFAFRIAPVQIGYLGYPGTSGAPFMDYLLVDPVVVPPEQAGHYSEQLLYLPHSYQANDNQRRIADTPITRSGAGLPQQGFVFCCFNNTFKISSREFDIWMRLLLQVEGSVLWLFRATPKAEQNLRRQAQLRGVDPGRLVFAERVAQAEHLARHRLADLFLDTFNYNAHTTASDALWAGLPLVTRAGEGFAARVGASLLRAIGLPELVADSDQAYEELARDLALDPQRLAAIADRLAANRLTTPLFDSELFTRHIEDGYQQAYQRYFEGGPPATIVVAP